MKSDNLSVSTGHFGRRYYAEKIIMLVLVCILFPAVVFANQNPNAVPGFDNLTWGESSRSVLQKYHLGRMPLTYDRNETICEISLDNPYIYEIRIMPTALMMFTNDKLYSVTFNFSSYPNDTEYNRIKKSLRKNSVNLIKRKLLTDNMNILHGTKVNFYRISNDVHNICP